MHTNGAQEAHKWAHPLIRRGLCVHLASKRSSQHIHITTAVLLQRFYSLWYFPHRYTDLLPSHHRDDNDDDDDDDDDNDDGQGRGLETVTFGVKKNSRGTCVFIQDLFSTLIPPRGRPHMSLHASARERSSHIRTPMLASRAWFEQEKGDLGPWTLPCLAHPSIHQLPEKIRKPEGESFARISKTPSQIIM